MRLQPVELRKAAWSQIDFDDALWHSQRGLRRLGYSSDEMTGHGFRTMASTLLNELGWNPDAIERQLAHDERDEKASWV